jgi:tryptophan synthase alpha chain
MREHTSLPLAVGFGISKPEHVAEVAQFADGVVVGSAIVKTIEANMQSADLPGALEAFTRQLSAPLRKAEWA